MSKNLMKNLFVSTTFLKDGQPLHEALELCKKEGIVSVELGSNHSYQNNYDYIKSYPFNYLVHNYFPIPKESFVLNIASLDKDIRMRSIEHVKKAINFCIEIDAELYTFHPGFITDPKGSNLSGDNYDFQWDEDALKNTTHTKAKSLLYQSLDDILEYSHTKEVQIAIETEGSLKKRDHLLMQHPKEYEEFITKYTPEEIGINLNLGHLNLAMKAFGFDHKSFLDLIQQHIVAFEMSHNDGLEDDHLPLLEDGWYWEIIKNPDFSRINKILEYRNTDVTDIVSNIKMIDRKINEI